MIKKASYLITGVALALCVQPALASCSVSTVPEGMMQMALPQGTSYMSMPLTKDPIYTGMVSAVTANTVSVADSPAPFTSSLEMPGAPYFVEFLTGNETGRVMLVTGNTSSALTLDVTDNGAGWTTVPLTSSGFNVQRGDSFEIFPGETLASTFGTGSSSSPLILNGGAAATAADQVTLCRATSLSSATYYFNTTAGFWEQTGSAANANNTIVYPYSGLSVMRQSGGSASGMMLMGRVTPVSACSKMIGGSWTYGGTRYPVGVTLAQLNLGSNWMKSSNGQKADLICVWNQSKAGWDNYYESTDSTWHLSSNPTADQSNFTIAAGNAITIGNCQMTTGAQDFMVSAMPYSLQ